MALGQGRSPQGERRKAFLALWGLWSRTLRQGIGIAQTRVLQGLERDLSALEDTLTDMAYTQWEREAKDLEKKIQAEENHG